MKPWDGMDTSSSMPEVPGVRKEQCWSHPSARDGEWGWIHTWASLKAESCSGTYQHDLHWHFLLAFLPMENHSQPACMQLLVLLKQSVTLSLSSLYIFPPLLLRAGVNVPKSPAHPCPCLGTQSRDWGIAYMNTVLTLCLLSAERC